jgi:hypothetical protein
MVNRHRPRPPHERHGLAREFSSRASEQHDLVFERLEALVGDVAFALNRLSDEARHVRNAEFSALVPLAILRSVSSFIAVPD